MKHLLAALAVVVVTCGASEATAHAVLLETAPADRSVVADAPAVALRFNEPVAPVAVRLIDDAGRAIEAAVTARDETVRLVPSAPLPRGGYIVSWRVISADSHPVAGAFQFAVGAPPANWAAPARVETGTPGWTAIAIVNRALHLIALTLAVGGALYGMLCGAPPRRAILWAAALGAVTALLSVGIEGGLVLDLPFSSLAGFEPWRYGAQTTRGLASGVAIVGLAAIAARLPLWGAAVVVASFALSGHAATAPPRIVAVPALLIHAAIALFWIGSFVPLRRAAPGEGRRFGRMSNWAVPALVLAGLILAVVQVRDWPPLVETTYGVTLLAKAALVAALVALVIRNRKKPIGRSAFVAAELALGMTILVATAILTEVPPPRSLVVAAAAPSTTVVAGKLVATVRIAPGLAGRNAVTVVFADDAGRPAAPREVTLLLSDPGAGIEEMERAMTRTPDGAWRHEGPELAVPGTWTVRIEALISDFDRPVFTTEMPIR